MGDGSNFNEFAKVYQRLSTDETWNFADVLVKYIDNDFFDGASDKPEIQTYDLLRRTLSFLIIDGKIESLTKQQYSEDGDMSKMSTVPDYIGYIGEKIQESVLLKKGAVNEIDLQRKREWDEPIDKKYIDILTSTKLDLNKRIHTVVETLLDA